MSPPLVTLRCQTVVDGALAFVKMPIDLMLWDSADETIRDHFRAKARTELRLVVAARIGQHRMDDRYDDLPVWEEFPDQCAVECVGGPRDGERIKLSSAKPPHALELPLPVRLEDLTTPATEPFPRALYRPLPDEHGFFSRTTDGAWRFGCQR
jgi:hypothetical protein